MNLLREIQEGATGNEPLTSLLRKAKLLAARLDHQPLKDWVDWELGGYPSVDELPPYRQGGEVPVLGDFGGPFGSGQMNRPIPPLIVEDPEIRAALFEWHYTQGVAAYEDMLKTGELAFQIPWPTNAVTLYQSRIIQGMALMSARRIVSAPEIAAVLDAVRNRLLELALEIEREDPDAGEAPVGQPTLPAERVSQVVNYAIYGGTNNLLTAGRDARQAVDLDLDLDLDLGARFETLRRELEDVGLSDENVEELRQALARDAADGQLDGQVGPATKGWLGGLAVRGAEVGSSATAGVVTGIVLKFLGAN